MNNSKYRIGQDLIELVRYYVTLARCARVDKQIYLELEQLVYKFYKENAFHLIQGFNEASGAKLIFSTDATSFIPASMLGKKANLYGSATLCLVTGGIREFSQLCLELAPLIIRGRLFPLMTYKKKQRKPSFFDESDNLLQDGIEDRLIQAYANDAKAVPIFGSQTTLLEQFSEEMGSLDKSRMGDNRLFLPTLDGIGLENMIELLEEHDNPTIRFREKFRSLLSVSKSSNSESELYQALQKVDLEVRNLHDSFEHIRKDRYLRNTETSVGALVISLSLFAPETTVLTNMTTVFGSISVFDGLRKSYLRNEAEKSAMMSPFYSPWLLHRKTRA